MNSDELIKASEYLSAALSNIQYPTGKTPLDYKDEKNKNSSYNANSPTIYKIKFMYDQCRVCSPPYYLLANEFNFAPEDLFNRNNIYSGDKLKYFDSPERYFFFPDCYLTLFTNDRIALIDSDLAFLASIKFYQGYIKEMRGNPKEAILKFQKAKTLLQDAKETEAVKYLKNEIQFREHLWKKYPNMQKHKGEYIKELVKHYIKVKNTRLALPLMRSVKY
jgi:hypothetical protein